MRKTGDVLIELGITPELTGFQYIIDMVEEMSKNPGLAITKLYTIVGIKRNSSAARVERGIRHAINTRLNMTKDEYKKYVGIYPTKLTNSMFLDTFKYKLENMED